jgi:hypothetical protein
VDIGAPGAPPVGRKGNGKCFCMELKMKKGYLFLLSYFIFGAFVGVKIFAEQKISSTNGNIMIGIYMSDKYLVELGKSKSHYQAMKNSDHPQGLKISIKDDSYWLMLIWNFHEGTYYKINSNFEVNDVDGNIYKCEKGRIIKNGKIGYTYIKDSADDSNVDGLKNYVLSVIFGDETIYSEFGELKYLNGKLLLNDKEYEFNLDSVNFIFSKMDYIEGSNKYYGIDIVNKKLIQIENPNNMF